MNPELLISHFNRISDAPDAVPRLRSFILDLAVRGKLVGQNPEDEPASELFKRIQTEKARVGAIVGIRRQAELSRVGAPEIPFGIPENWKWVRLIDLLLKLTDGTHHSPPNVAQGDFKYITAKNIKPEGVSLEDVTYISKDVHHEIYARCNPERGDILYIKDGATTGVVTINNLDEPFSLLSSVALLKASRAVSNRLLVEFLRSPFFYMQMRGFMKGAAITRVTLKRMAPALVPLPPTAEQHRIVAKIDELMALCNRLESEQRERESRLGRLTTASHHHLNNGADAEDLLKHAHFFIGRLPRLTTRPDQIKQLRQTILNLAVRGKLLPTSSASKTPKPLREFATLQNGYAFKSEWFVRSGIRLLRNINVSHGVIRWENAAFLAEKRAAEFERFKLNEGDVVLSLDRPFIVSGTKVARVRHDDMPCLLLQRVGRFQVNLDRLSPDYLFLWLYSPHFTKQIDPGRSNGVPHISSKQVEATELFVPSLGEQGWIVTKVRELMTLCDQLEARLTSIQTDFSRLLDAVLYNSLNGGSSTVGYAESLLQTCDIP